MAHAISLKESAQLYLKDALKPGGIPGDLWNGMAGIQFNLEDSQSWPNLKPAKTFAEYLNIKFRDNAALAKEVMKAADGAEVAKFDAIVKKMNEIVAHGVEYQGQANVIGVLLDDVRFLIYGRRKS